MTKYEPCESRLSNLLAMLDDQDLTLETRFEILSEIFALQKEEIDELNRKLREHVETVCDGCGDAAD
jgi:hypothetical protein